MLRFIIAIFYYIVIFSLFGYCHFRRHSEMWVQFIFVRLVLQYIGLLHYIHFLIYQTITLVFLLCTVIIFTKDWFFTLHHFVFLSFLFHIHFSWKLDDYINQVIFYYSLVYVFPSRRDIYPIKNINFSEIDAYIYVSRSCLVWLLFQEDFSQNTPDMKC